jgi:sporulation protein YlmC with PRC-barrel domain
MVGKYAVAGLLAGLLGSALLTSLAVAQTPAPVPRADTTTSAMPQSHSGMWRASKLVGVNVYNDNNESLGNINDLIVDANGAAKNVIIGVGGFLGVGERYISVNFDKLKWSNEPMKTAATTAPAGGMDSGRTVGSTSTTPPTPMAPPASTTSSKADSWYPDHAVLSASKDDVKAMPEFKY